MKQTYQGSCHCGTVRFEVEADLDHVRVCDCSTVEDVWGVNVRCLEGVDPSNIPRKQIYGSRLD